MKLEDVIEEEREKFLSHPAMKRVNDIELTAIVTGRVGQYSGETLDVAFTQAMQKAALAVVEMLEGMKVATLHSPECLTSDGSEYCDCDNDIKYNQALTEASAAIRASLSTDQVTEK